eukprot:TRINITY_DN20967_c0_g1_i1.p2 TRINITY_DN20967_c0_g1~~TRINITY_DN20967_c0_g1_i1.p2  ORF type:complete len:159 (+),score=35.78 TRINITY_DN20967_c0_g1_i1:42-518(+)
MTQICILFFFQAEDGIRDVERSRGLGDVYKRQVHGELIIDKTSSLTEFESKQRILTIIMHAADISNPCRPFEISQEWSKCVVNEFFIQGDFEKSKGRPVSFLCDRETTKLVPSQVGFINGIVRPYYEKIVEIFPLLHPMLDNINLNEKKWKATESSQS